VSVFLRIRSLKQFSLLYFKTGKYKQKNRAVIKDKRRKLQMPVKMAKTSGAW